MKSMSIKEEGRKVKEKVRERASVLVVAKALSDIFRPTYYPLVGFLILLTLTYLSQLPWLFKFGMLLLVYIFTIFIPAMGVYLYRHSRKLSPQDLLLQKNRIVPYVLHILSYGMLLYYLRSLHTPVFVGAIIVISLLVQVACTVITLWWKISMHSAGAGAIIGTLVVYSAIFHFNPVWWLCAAILVSGLVNSSRMLLRQHTLGQVLGGTFVGFFCGLTGFFI